MLRRPGRRAHFRRQILQRQHIAAQKHQGLLNDVFQLTNIAAVIVADQRFNRRRFDFQHRTAHLAVVFRHKCFDQRRNVFRSFPQRRQMDVHHIQTKIEILAKLACRHQLFQIAIGRRQYPHINLFALARADRHDLFFLHDTQQFCLQPLVQFADFIQEHRSPVSPFE